MTSKEVGRNDPCPCGSGKKFKKCCILGDRHTEKKKQHQKVKAYNEINYGKPNIDHDFFNKNLVHEFSAMRLIYSNLLMPEIASLAAKFAKTYLKISRGDEEKKLIEETDDASALIDIMSGVPDMLNHGLLIEKILQKYEATIPLILERLKTETSPDSFVEMAVSVLHRSKKDHSNQILELIKNYSLDAYKICVLCVLLGFYNNAKSLEVLWNYYHYFKEYFSEETLSDGPLLGMIEITERKKESAQADKCGDMSC